MKMIARQNHCINPKRPVLAAFANSSAQENREVSVQRIGARRFVTTVKKEPPET
jgi:hypothetical protein